MITRVQSYFRSHSVSIGLTIIALAFLSILAVLAMAVDKLQTQVETDRAIADQTRTIVVQTKAILGQISVDAAQRTQQIDGINDHINCIFTFFTLDPKARTATMVAPLPPGQKTCTLQTATGTVTVPLTSSGPVISPPPTPKPTSSPAAAATGAPKSASATLAPTPRPAVAVATPAPTPTPVVPFITHSLDNLLNRLLGVQ